MDITLDETLNILSIKYTNTLIKVFKNYVYEETDLLNNQNYQMLFKTTKNLSIKYKYINYNIKNSHDIVSYLMILMNYNCDKDMLRFNNGIFRTTIINSTYLPSFLPDDVYQFVKIWNSSCGQYINLNRTENKDIIRHEMIEMDAYIHITSPIRRLVDLLNKFQLNHNHNMLVLSDDAKLFYKKWIEQLDYINMTMRAIKKVQNECSLLDKCFNDTNILEKIYDGYCFDKLVRNDGLYQYIIYLPDIKIVSRITTRENMDNYQLKQYKLYVFNNEEKFKKKIRLSLVK